MLGVQAIDFPPVLPTALIRQKFSNFQNEERMLINYPNNSEYQGNLCNWDLGINQYIFLKWWLPHRRVGLHAGGVLKFGLDRGVPLEPQTPTHLFKDG